MQDTRRTTAALRADFTRNLEIHQGSCLRMVQPATEKQLKNAKDSTSSKKSCRTAEENPRCDLPKTLACFSEGVPHPRLFLPKSAVVLENNGVNIFQGAKECARISKQMG